MKMRNNPNLTKMFRGFRVNEKPFLKLDVKYLEKRNVLTSLQKIIVEYNLSKCTEKTYPGHVARLCALLEKPVVEAKVNQFGDPIEQPEEAKKDEIQNIKS